MSSKYFLKFLAKKGLRLSILYIQCFSQTQTSPVYSLINVHALNRSITVLIVLELINYGQFNLHFSGPSPWNNLDEELKSFFAFI